MSPRPELPDLTDQWIALRNGHLGTSLIAALTRVNANVLIVDKQSRWGQMFRLVGRAIRVKSTTIVVI